jgi:hypothetical protein
VSTTTTDVARVEPGQAVTLRASMDYAHALAQSNLLPAQYRLKPANVLWALEYGRTIGLTPMAAITGVHVIEGKPTASAGLISGLVRRAGHRLRVRGDDTKAVVEIVRSDDPEYTFRTEWTLERARTAGLTNKSVWKQYPAAMLKARAVAECARDACEEVLFGLHYTPEELGAEVNEDGEVLTVTTTTPAEGIPAADTAAAQADVDRQWREWALDAARKATAAGDTEHLRDLHSRGTREARLIDVSEAVTGPERVTALMYDDAVGTEGPLTLARWIHGCAVHLEQGGGMSVADAVSAGQEPESAEEATATAEVAELDYP